MASSTPNVIASLAFLLVLLPLTVDSDLLSPLMSPIVEKICDDIPCGKGTCKPDVKNPFSFECVCDQGWKQPIPDRNNSLKFLPCIIPNCTLNNACNEAPSPVQKSSNNTDILDPCRWVDCGGGSCNKTSSFTYDCVCDEGHHNLLNTTAFPCFKECAIGLNCVNLGIPTSNRSSPPPNMAERSQNQACSHLPGNFQRLILLIVSVFVAMRK